MAEKLCNLKKSGSSGGGSTETLLWQNSGTTQPSFPITLSQSIDNFSKIVIEYLPNTSVNDIYKIEVPSSAISNSQLANGNPIAGSLYSNAGRYLYFYTTTDRTKLYGAGSNLSNTNIIMAIYGIA